MSIINAGNTTTTAFRVTADTTGNVLIQSNGTNVATVNTAGIILSTGTALYYPDGSSSNTAASAVAGAVNVTLQQGYGGF
jgi:hypothetical protein